MIMWIVVPLFGVLFGLLSLSGLLVGNQDLESKNNLWMR
jgi:hypothetical protein